jgi:hypothetical protein
MPARAATMRFRDLRRLLPHSGAESIPHQDSDSRESTRVGAAPPRVGPARSRLMRKGWDPPETPPSAEPSLPGKDPWGSPDDPMDRADRWRGAYVRRLGSGDGAPAEGERTRRSRPGRTDAPRNGEYMNTIPRFGASGRRRPTCPHRPCRSRPLKQCLNRLLKIPGEMPQHLLPLALG